MVQMYEDLLVWLIPRMNCFGSIEAHGLYLTQAERFFRNLYCPTMYLNIKLQ